MALQITCDNVACPSSTVAPVVALADVEAYYTTPTGGTWRKKARVPADEAPTHWYRRGPLVHADGSGKVHACTEPCADAIDAANLAG